MKATAIEAIATSAYPTLALKGDGKWDFAKALQRSTMPSKRRL